VLQGMEDMLDSHAVRDIIFEEAGGYPAPTHRFLKSKGYSIFGLEEGFWRVKIIPDAAPRFDPVIGPTPNYLATIDSARAIQLLGRSTWQSFGIFRCSE
jgi:hypothetical protein